MNTHLELDELIDPDTQQKVPGATLITSFINQERVNDFYPPDADTLLLRVDIDPGVAGRHSKLVIKKRIAPTHRLDNARNFMLAIIQGDSIRKKTGNNVFDYQSFRRGATLELEIEKDGDVFV